MEECLPRVHKKGTHLQPRLLMKTRRIHETILHALLMICCSPTEASPGGHCAYGTLPGRWVNAPPTPEKQEVRQSIQRVVVAYCHQWNGTVPMAPLCADLLATYWQEADLEDLQQAVSAVAPSRYPHCQQQQQPHCQPSKDPFHWRLHRQAHPAGCLWLGNCFGLACASHWLQDRSGYTPGGKPCLAANPVHPA